MEYIELVFPLANSPYYQSFKQIEFGYVKLVTKVTLGPGAFNQLAWEAIHQLLHGFVRLSTADE